jgi:hypothetical protein
LYFSCDWRRHQETPDGHLVGTFGQIAAKIAFGLWEKGLENVDLNYLDNGNCQIVATTFANISKKTGTIKWA